MIFLKKINNRLIDYSFQVSIDPSLVVYYGVPYSDLKNNFRKSEYPIIKKYHYVKYKYRQFIIPYHNNINISQFKSNSRYKFMKDLWARELDYYKTKKYNEFKKIITDGGTVFKKNKYVIRNDKDLKKFFQDYINLLESMSKYGYNTKLKQNPIQVWIGANGELIKESCGRHRLAAAQVTGLKQIPVRITHIHQTWVESQIEDHKDLDIQTIITRTTNLLNLKVV